MLSRKSVSADNKYKMSENFDSYNAPQFFDFNKDLQKEDYGDTYFDYQEVNRESVVDPLKFRASEEMQVNNIEYEERKSLRRSLSTGNLPLLDEMASNSEHEDVKTVSNDLDGLCLSNTKKCISKNMSTNNLKMASTTSLSKSKLSSSQIGAQRLTRNVSVDNLTRLSQQKRHFGSAQNLGQNDYVTMAEYLRKFPNSFRSIPKLESTNVTHSKPTKTISQSPNLITKQRHRQVNAISREQQEQLEYEEAQKFKIKAHPLNKKILQGPLKPLVPIKKKPSTVPEPFNFTIPPRKVADAPKKEVYEFHPKPVPKSLYEPLKLKEVQKVSAVKPQTPTFMKRYYKEHVKSQKNPESENQSTFKLGPTVPVPFSFEYRTQLIQKRKEEMIKKSLEEEKERREFHARPVPRAILNSARSSNMEEPNSLNDIQTKAKSKSVESLTGQFKARPATVLYQKPFEPKKEERHLTEITEFQLNTEKRAKDREVFEQYRREKEDLVDLAMQLEEQKRLQKEEEEIAKIRKQTQYKAKPIKKYKQVEILPSGKLTEPVSPNFHADKYRNKENKGN